MAAGLALAVFSSTPVIAPLTAQAAEKEQKVGEKVGKPLKAAIDAAQKKQWDQALAKVKEAQAVEKKSTFEEYKINEILGFVLINQKKYGEAAAVYEKMLDSGQTPPDEVDGRVKQIAQMYLQVQQYSKATEYVKRWLKDHPGDPEMTYLLGQLQYQQGQYKAAVDTLQGVIASDEKRGQTPKENVLQIVLTSADKLGDDATRQATLEKLIRYYPKTEYWEPLLLTEVQKQNPDRVSFVLYQLMLDTGTLKRPQFYEEMAQLAIEQGIPGEAQKVMESGFASKVLGADEKQKERHTRLLNNAKKAAEQDRASLAQQAKDADKAPNGQAWVGLGQAYLSYDQYDQAIDALQKGIKKGGLKNPDEAQIQLGIAYLKKNQREQARNAFKAVPSDSPFGKAATLWGLRATNAA